MGEAVGKGQAVLGTTHRRRPPAIPFLSRSCRFPPPLASSLPVITRCHCRCRFPLRLQGVSAPQPPPLLSLGIQSRGRSLWSSYHISTIFPGTCGRSKSRITVVQNKHSEAESSGGKRFWAAVGLIMGTAVGPGMLGLPSATIKSGPLPSTLVIVVSWVYVVSSILLVAELCTALMEADGVGEVSFIGLAKHTLGNRMGWLVGMIYASLNFVLLIACVSGIGSVVSRWFPAVPPLVANAIFPCAVGCTIGFFPFDVIDSTNRAFCFFMLLSISALVVVGMSMGRSDLLRSFNHASWSLSAILPAIPVTVLTLGFHVITPFVCKVVASSAYEARRAILFGGTIPLLMVLSWNLVVLGLAGTSSSAPEDPIKFLLSVSPAALPAVQGFAFSALATSLIGYALGFPKQLLDMVGTIGERKPNSSVASFVTKEGPDADILGRGKSGSGRPTVGPLPSGVILSFTEGSIQESEFQAAEKTCPTAPATLLSKLVLPSDPSSPLMMLMVLGVPVIIATFFREAFSAALDYAGVYANCFLFGALPPVMAWIHRSRRKDRPGGPIDIRLLPGREISLLLLFCIAVVLGVWH